MSKNMLWKDICNENMSDFSYEFGWYVGMWLIEMGVNVCN